MTIHIHVSKVIHIQDSASSTKRDMGARQRAQTTSMGHLESGTYHFNEGWGRGMRRICVKVVEDQKVQNKVTWFVTDASSPLICIIWFSVSMVDGIAQTAKDKAIAILLK